MQKVSNMFCPFSMFLLSLFISGTVFSQAIPDSDIKTNIQPITLPVKMVNLLEPRVFEYNTSGYRHLKLPSGTNYGFIAEDVQKVFPDLVYYKKVSYMKGKNFFQAQSIPQVNLEGMIPLLVASVQEQQAEIDQLKKMVAELRARIDDIKK